MIDQQPFITMTKLRVMNGYLITPQ